MTGVTYLVCLEYDIPNEDTTLYVDLDGGTWCAGEHTTASANGTNPQLGIDGYLFQGNQSIVAYLDEITACNY